MIFCLPCLALIIYFSILGIFLPSKRNFIKDAIQCFWKKLTFQHCTDAFDDLVHKQFVMWLSEKNKDSLAHFFSKKRNFDIVLSLATLVFIVLNGLLLILMYRWLFIKSPCDSQKGVCPL